jgi:hypothetical protein
MSAFIGALSIRPTLIYPSSKKVDSAIFFPDGVALHSPGKYPKNSHLAEQTYAI